MRNYAPYLILKAVKIAPKFYVKFIFLSQSQETITPK